MFAFYFERQSSGEIFFGLSLLLMLLSLALSLQEILISVKALNIELQDLEKPCD
jgi:hypothetical protein